MKTRPQDPDRKQPLPPPPAPPARDANPWTMTSQTDAAARPPRHPRAPGRLPRDRTPPHMRPYRDGRPQWVPLMVLVFVAGAGVQMALRALEERNLPAVLGALAIVAVSAFILLRGVLRRKR